MRARRRARGFTLIEVMLTVAITAAVFAMIGGILISVINSAERIEKLLRTEKAGYGILTTLRRDLTGVYAYALGGPAFKGVDKAVGGREADRLFFVTTARVLPAEEGRPPPTLVEVGYVLRESELREQGLSLFRRAAPFEGDPLEGPGEYVEIFSGIESFQLTYLDPEDRQWKDSWEEGEALPLAVKLELKLALSPEERAAAEQDRLDLPEPTFEMIVGIPVQMQPKADPAPEQPAPTGQ
ncbi:MAG: prepilin-type N-terminal cleavage/methylation domain-containing protein [Planctomycetota bacterium]|nr:prepilin-type N-terminal cleavage/methylation domain-containing protein [Planctomycetota bacterium]